MNAYHSNSTRSLAVVVCMLLRTPHLSCSVLHFVILIYMYGVGLRYLSNLYIPVLLTHQLAANSTKLDVERT